MITIQGMYEIIDRQQRVAGRLRALAGSSSNMGPPQSLVLEGGSRSEREAMALYWACLNNCQHPAEGAACLDCAPCRQILDRAFNDLITFPLPEEDKVKVEHVRSMRPVWGQPPRGEGKRVTIFLAAQDLLTEAANTLLKTLEEPRPGNLFVLCAPQRAKLLPTLVSRSFVMTLSWTDGTPSSFSQSPSGQAPAGRPPTGHPQTDKSPDQAAHAERLAAVDEWAGALIAYWARGKDWFQRTLVKGAVDVELARAVVLRCQRALASSMSGKDDPLAAPLTAMAPRTRRTIGLALEQAEEWLDFKPSPVTPPLVLDWLASRLT